MVPLANPAASTSKSTDGVWSEYSGFIFTHQPVDLLFSPIWGNDHNERASRDEKCEELVGVSIGYLGGLFILMPKLLAGSRGGGERGSAEREYVIVYAENLLAHDSGRGSLPTLFNQPINQSTN